LVGFETPVWDTLTRSPHTPHQPHPLESFI
jgi:hypothetical protein